jgi:N-acetylmuramoyl-L-alanine amidase
MKPLESAARIRTMLRVFKPVKILLCLLPLLAGCAGVPREKAPDWNAESDNSTATEPTVERVTESPRVAPPANIFSGAENQPKNTTANDALVSLDGWTAENNSAAPEPVLFSLTTSNGVFEISTKTPVAKWNGMELWLGFQPELIDGRPFVHKLDLEKNIEPLISGVSVPAKTNRVIVIDAGHGGANAGAKSALGETYEKKFTLDWAMRLKALLETNGWNVFLTRTKDSDISLSDRVAFADRHHADLFISLHFNSVAPNEESSGLETYCLTPTGMPSTLTRGYEDNVSLVFPNNRFDAENLRWAIRLHSSILKETELNDRGIRRARFLRVLREQDRPAVLIEGGFLSNPTEARRIADPAFREKLAQAVADALR